MWLLWIGTDRGSVDFISLHKSEVEAEVAKKLQRVPSGCRAYISYVEVAQ